MQSADNIKVIASSRIILNGTTLYSQSNIVKIKIDNIDAAWWVTSRSTGTLQVQELYKYEFSVNFKVNGTLITSLPYQVVDQKTVNFTKPTSSQFANSPNNSEEFEILIRLKNPITYDDLSIRKHIFDCYKGILDNKSYSDFRVFVKGKEYKVHRAILASQSSYFKAMFDSDMQESIQHESKIDDLEPDIFDCLLRFIYTGDLPENIGDLSKKLYKAAHYYQVEKLKEICKQEIHAKLTDENALELYNWAFLYDINDLKLDAWKIVKRETLEISKPMKNEPLTPDEVQEIIDYKKKDAKFWNKFF